MRFIVLFEHRYLVLAQQWRERWYGKTHPEVAFVLNERASLATFLAGLTSKKSVVKQEHLRDACR